MEKEVAKPRAGAKSATAFRTISEVSDELDVPQHVLRFWETKFPQVRPLKRGGGRRYYRPEDVALLRKIQRLLYSEGYTIKGVQRLLKEQRQTGADTEGAEALVDSLTGADAGGDDLSGDDLVDDDSAGDEFEGDDPSEPARPVASPVAQLPLAAVERPRPAVAAVPAAKLPLFSQASKPVTLQVAAPQTPAPAPAPVPASAGELPVWVRRELTNLRSELSDLKAVLRKAIR